MSVSSQQVDAKSIWSDPRRWFLPGKKQEPKTVLTFSGADTPEEILEKLKSYSISYWDKAGQAAVASMDDEEDPDSYIIESRYNDHQLLILEDCYVSDPVINASVNKLVFGTVGPHGKTVLDTKKEFSIEQERRDEINTIVGISKYSVAKSEVDELFIDENIQFYTNLLDFLTNHFVYGRSAWFVMHDRTSAEKQTMQKIKAGETGDAEQNKPGLPAKWNNLILLDSKRLGRVKVNKETHRITHVEYLDVEVNKETGEMRPAIVNSSTVKDAGDNEIKAAWIPMDPNDPDAKSGYIIYHPYTSGGAPKNARYVGYSRIESIVHISQVKRIIMNKNVKEAAETHYAGIGRVQFDPNTPDQLITNFINSMKGAMGKWFGHKIPVTVTVEKIPVDLKQYEPIVDLINREILRCIGLASFLVGYEQIANYANSEQILLATNQFDIRPLRSKIKDFLQVNVLDPLFRYYLKNPQPGQSGQSGEPLPQDESGQSGQSLERQDGETAVQDEKKPKKPRKIEDRFVKLTYEFEDITFSTKPELADFYQKIRAIVPSLPDEAVLRGTGLDNWVDESQAQAEEKKQEALKAKEEFMKDPITAQTVMQQKEKFNNYSKGAVAAFDTSDPDIKAAILETELVKQRMLKAIEKKYA